MKESYAGLRVARFADTEVLRYEVPSFEELPLRDKLFVYYLGRATTAGRDIFTDQNGAMHLLLRSVLEAIYMHYRGDRLSADFGACVDYLRRVWFASGVYHHYGEHKFEAAFSDSFFRQATASVAEFLPEDISSCIDDLSRLIFDADYLPVRTSAAMEGDIVQDSAVNYYEYVCRQEAEDYYSTCRKKTNAPTSPGLNSKLTKQDGLISEEVWRSGGTYGAFIDQIIQELHTALPYAASEGQAQCMELLIDYYRSGNLHTFDQYSIEWVADTDSPIDFINGFIETYQDPLGLKGSWEGLVQIRDTKASERTRLLSSRAWWFEANAPIDPQYRKPDPKGVSASVVHTAILGGDAYPATPIGINLPNADSIRTSHGSKSVTIENIHSAYEQASLRSGMDEVFVPDPKIRDLLLKYGSETDRLHTDLHECLGHGSGRLAPNVDADALGPYHSTIEEARADLFALYFLGDNELVRLGLLSSVEAYHAAYYRYMLNGLITQLIRIEPGRRIEESHMRNRALIARYVLAQAESAGAMNLDGIRLQISDYTIVRRIIAQLLREVQRIKSEGDVKAAEDLINAYAVDISETIHKEVLRRYAALDLAPYRGFVNPRYMLSYDSTGNINNVRIDYTEGYEQQMLRYSHRSATARWTEIYRKVGADRCSKTTESLDWDPTYEMLNNEEQAAAKLLRTSLRRRMDGVIASGMRAYGINHQINFGVSRQHLDELSQLVLPSAALARYLFGREVRELRLLALRLFPTEEMSEAEAQRWAIRSEEDVELRNELPALVFDRIPSAASWAFGWIERGIDTKAVAFTTLARAISRLTFVPTQVEQDILIDIAAEVLTTTKQHQAAAAALLLKRIGRLSEEASNAVRTSLHLHYTSDHRSTVSEYIEDIAFDIDYQH